MKTSGFSMKFILTAPSLLLAAALWAPPATASVRVYGEASSSGPQISVQVYADITSPAIVSHTFKVFYDPRQLQVAQANGNEAVWFFHNGTAVVPGPSPAQPTNGEVLFMGAHFDARDPHTGVTGNRTLLASLVFNRVNGSQATPGFELSIGRAGQFANFVAITGEVLEAQPGAVTLLAVQPTAGDLDLDGLQDRWEENAFGSIQGVFYSDDPDGDGVNNLGEQALGSDPNDPASNLSLTLRERNGRMVLSWPSAADRTYTVEAGNAPNRYKVLEEGIKATPPFNSMELEPGVLGANGFFRVRLDGAAPPANR